MVATKLEQLKMIAGWAKTTRDEVPAERIVEFLGECEKCGLNTSLRMIRLYLEKRVKNVDLNSHLGKIKEAKKYEGITYYRTVARLSGEIAFIGEYDTARSVKIHIVDEGIWHSPDIDGLFTEVDGRMVRID